MNPGKRILIVDDEPDLLKSLAYRLKKSGYDVVEAVSGEEGLKKAEETRPGLILLDWRLPAMPGTEVYKRLKADANLKHIPIVFLTASREQAELERLKQEMGIEHIMIKPYEFKEVLAKIQELIG
jgi:DNA-binding response OmpR family regulator